ncbi:MAG: hypothetical protein C0420_09955 [Methylobacterium sp.]|nr:hypothetical protein [Methylobacterium sp.]
MTNGARSLLRYAGPRMRSLLPTILLVLALASCSERFDTDQQRLCRQAIPALNAPGTPITIERSGTGSRPHVLRMIYLAGPAEARCAGAASTASSPARARACGAAA